MYARNMRSRRRQQGMTLVELMVGLVVGLLITLAALGSAQFFMGMQRQSVGTGSALGNASTALSAVKYEVGQAGLGFYADGSLLCPTMNLSSGTTSHASSATFPPLAITTTAGGVTTLDAVYASVLEAAAPAKLAAPVTSSSTSLTVASYLPIASGQSVMLVPAAGSSNPCTVRSATTVAASTDTVPETLGMAGDGKNNQVSFSTVSYTTSDYVAPLGDLSWSRFRLDGTNFLMERPLDGKQAVMARNVMAFRAEYGVSNGVTDALASWEKAEGSYATLTAAQIPLVRAVRVGLLVRSETPEKPDASGTCTATTTAPMLFGVSVTLTGTDWQCYRYRSSTVVVPLRNVVLGTGA